MPDAMADPMLTEPSGKNRRVGRIPFYKTAVAVGRYLIKVALFVLRESAV